MKAAKSKAKKFVEAYEQLLKDQEILRAFASEKLRHKMGKDINKELFRYPGFVVMPNCTCPVDSVAVPSNGIFKEDCENVEAFSKWWKRNITNKRTTTFNRDLFKFLVLR